MRSPLPLLFCSVWQNEVLPFVQGHFSHSDNYATLVKSQKSVPVRILSLQMLAERQKVVNLIYESFEGPKNIFPVVYSSKSLSMSFKKTNSDSVEQIELLYNNNEVFNTTSTHVAIPALRPHSQSRGLSPYAVLDSTIKSPPSGAKELNDSPSGRARLIHFGDPQNKLFFEPQKKLILENTYGLEKNPSAELQKQEKNLKKHVIDPVVVQNKPKKNLRATINLNSPPQATASPKSPFDVLVAHQKNNNSFQDPPSINTFKRDESDKQKSFIWGEPCVSPSISKIGSSAALMEFSRRKIAQVSSPNKMKMINRLVSISSPRPPFLLPSSSNHSFTNSNSHPYLLSKRKFNNDYFSKIEHLSPFFCTRDLHATHNPSFSQYPLENNNTIPNNKNNNSSDLDSPPSPEFASITSDPNAFQYPRNFLSIMSLNNNNNMISSQLELHDSPIKLPNAYSFLPDENIGDDLLKVENIEIQRYLHEKDDNLDEVRLSNSASNVETLNEEKINLNNLMKVEDEMAKKTNEKIELLNNKLTILQHKLKNTQFQHESLESLIQVMKSERDLVKDKLKEKVESMEQLEVIAKDQSELVDELRGMINILKVEADDYKTRMEILESQNARLQAKILANIHSTPIKIDEACQSTDQQFNTSLKNKNERSSSNANLNVNDSSSHTFELSPSAAALNTTGRLSLGSPISPFFINNRSGMNHSVNNNLRKDTNDVHGLDPFFVNSSNDDDFQFNQSEQSKTENEKLLKKHHELPHAASSYIPSPNKSESAPTDLSGSPPLLAGEAPSLLFNPIRSPTFSDEETNFIQQEPSPNPHARNLSTGTLASKVIVVNSSNQTTNHQPSSPNNSFSRINRPPHLVTNSQSNNIYYATNNSSSKPPKPPSSPVHLRVYDFSLWRPAGSSEPRPDHYKGKSSIIYSTLLKGSSGFVGSWDRRIDGKRIPDDSKSVKAFIKVIPNHDFFSGPENEFKIPKMPNLDPHSIVPFCIAIYTEFEHQIAQVDENKTNSMIINDTVKPLIVLSIWHLRDAVWLGKSSRLLAAEDPSLAISRVNCFGMDPKFFLSLSVALFRIGKYYEPLAFAPKLLSSNNLKTQSRLSSKLVNNSNAAKEGDANTISGPEALVTEEYPVEFKADVAEEEVNPISELEHQNELQDVEENNPFASFPVLHNIQDLEDFHVTNKTVVNDNLRDEHLDFGETVIDKGTRTIGFESSIHHSHYVTNTTPGEASPINCELPRQSILRKSIGNENKAAAMKQRRSVGFNRQKEEREFFIGSGNNDFDNNEDDGNLVSSSSPAISRKSLMKSRNSIPVQPLDDTRVRENQPNKKDNNNGAIRRYSNALSMRASTIIDASSRSDDDHIRSSNNNVDDNQEDEGVFDFEQWRPFGRALPSDKALKLNKEKSHLHKGIIGTSVIITKWEHNEDVYSDAVENPSNALTRCWCHENTSLGMRRRWIVCNPWNPHQFLVYFKNSPPRVEDLLNMMKTGGLNYKFLSSSDPNQSHLFYDQQLTSDDVIDTYNHLGHSGSNVSSTDSSSVETSSSEWNGEDDEMSEEEDFLGDDNQNWQLKKCPPPKKAPSTHALGSYSVWELRDAYWDGFKLKVFIKTARGRLSCITGIEDKEFYLTMIAMMTHFKILLDPISNFERLNLSVAPYFYWKNHKKLIGGHSSSYGSSQFLANPVVSHADDETEFD